MSPFHRNLLSRLIKHLGWRSDRVKSRDIRAIWWSLSTIHASDGHHLVVRLGISVARECRGRVEEIVTGARDAEWGYKLPLKSDSHRDSIHDRATRGSLPFARNG